MKLWPGLLCSWLLINPLTVWAQAADQVGEASQLEVSVTDEDRLDLSKNVFEHETQVGFILTTGNTDSVAVNGKTFTLYRVKRWENQWEIGAYFNRISAATSSATTTGTVANYVWGTYRLDYYFLPLTTVYFGGGGYTDEIKGIDLGAQAFSGVSHYFIYTKKHSCAPP